MVHALTFCKKLQNRCIINKINYPNCDTEAVRSCRNSGGMMVIPVHVRVFLATCITKVLCIIVNACIPKKVVMIQNYQHVPCIIHKRGDSLFKMK